MRELMEKLYEEMFEPKITPYELVNNAKLDNYEYVNMYKKGDFLFVESSCRLSTGEKAEFYYKFDQNDHLLSLTSIINNNINIEYDREKEIKELKKQLSKLMSIQPVAV